MSVGEKEQCRCLQNWLLCSKIAVWLEFKVLYTDQEREIMKDAVQPNMRKANISVTPFQNIVDDHPDIFDFKDKDVLDIGPGQLDFLDIAKKNGSKTTVGIDFDPAIKELGKVRGHEICVVDLRQDWPFHDRQFDLIFCRGSINCFWYTTEERLNSFLNCLSSSLRPGGHLWIAPWNKPGAGREDYTETVDRLVFAWAEANEITVQTPEKDIFPRYGIGYQIPTVSIWKR